MKITIILLSLLLSLGSARLAAEPLVNITAEQRQAIGIEPPGDGWERARR